MNNIGLNYSDFFNFYQKNNTFSAQNKGQLGALGNSKQEEFKGSGLSSSIQGEFNEIENEIQQTDIMSLFAELFTSILDFLSGLGSMFMPDNRGELSDNCIGEPEIAELVSDEELEELDNQYSIHPQGALTMQDGVTYYSDSDGNLVEFGYDEEEYSELAQYFSSLDEDYEMTADDLSNYNKYLAMKEYFRESTYGIIESDLTPEEIAPDSELPETVDEEEYSEIMKKIKNNEIPTDEELAKVKIYLNSLSEDELLELYSAALTESVESASEIKEYLSEEGDLIFYAINEDGNNGKIVISQDGTVTFNGMETSLTKEEALELLGKDVKNDKKGFDGGKRGEFDKKEDIIIQIGENEYNLSDTVTSEEEAAEYAQTLNDLISSKSYDNVEDYGEGGIVYQYTDDDGNSVEVAINNGFVYLNGRETHLDADEVTAIIEEMNG